MGETLRAARYTRRVVDDEIDQLIAGGASAIAIEGAKAVGKSATGAERATTTYRLEDPQTLEIVTEQPVENRAARHRVDR